MFVEATLYIGSNAGVETLIIAANDIEKPILHVNTLGRTNKPMVA
jgi:hypothetical protein